MRIPTDDLINGTLKQMGHAPSFMGDSERKAVRLAIDAGAQHGFGNVMGWLATAWAQSLVESGLPAKTAVGAVHGTPYPLPKP